MDSIQVKALHNCQRDLMHDLEVDRQFLLNLYVDGIITDEQKSEILEESSRRDKCMKLMEILPRRGPNWFPKFVTRLRRDHSWLADELNKEFIKEHEKSINDHLIDVINQHVSPVVYGSVTNILAHGINPKQIADRLSALMTSLKNRSLKALDMSTYDHSISEVSLPKLIERKIKFFHDEIYKLETTLTSERNECGDVKSKNDKKLSKEILKLQKDLEKQKKLHTSGMKKKDNRITKLEKANQQLKNENIELKARLDELKKAATLISGNSIQGSTTVAQLFP